MNFSRDRACETRPWSRGLVSRLVSQGLAARPNSTKAPPPVCTELKYRTSKHDVDQWQQEQQW